MADKEIKDFVYVTDPAITDTFVCQQSGVTKKITTEQILSNINNFSAASAFDGTETLHLRQSATNAKTTIEDIAKYILEYD